MDEYMGAVMLFACHFVPERWLPCDGRLMPINENYVGDVNAALFSLLGSQYGGDGMKNFALPNMAPVASVDGPPLQYCICVEGLYPPGSPAD
jgi:microcystin-dependent protein